MLGSLAFSVGCDSSQIECPASNSAKAEMVRLDQALAFFKLDYGRFPSEEEGLQALLERPPGTEFESYPPSGYLKAEAMVDPWGYPYQYRWPGECGVDSPELRSLGSDGDVGGNGEASDLSNCPKAKREELR